MTILPRGTEHIRLAAGAGASRGGWVAIVSYGDRETEWFEIQPHSRGVALQHVNPYTLDVSEAPISVRALRRIMLDAERSIELLERAASIAGERAAEALARPLTRSVWLVRDFNTLILILFFNSGSSPSLVKVSVGLENELRLHGRRLLHGRTISLGLRGDMVSGEEFELLRQLAKDLSAIFGAPKLLRDLVHVLSVRAEAVVWSETTAHRTLEPPRRVDRIP